MNNLSEIINQLKNNQEKIRNKLAKVEDLGSNVGQSVLRDLIQEARELHEGAVVLSYILFNEDQKKESKQLEILLSEDEHGQLHDNPQSPSEEDQLMDALDEALDFTQKEIETEKMVSEISNEISALDPQEELPSQEALTAELEEEISSVISAFSVPKKEQIEEDNSLAAQLAKQRIESLSSAIGINEKFLLTNELFDGNTEQFIQAIEDLNSCLSLQEANSKLVTMAKKRNWEKEEEPFQKLQALLERKHQ